MKSKTNSVGVIAFVAVSAAALAFAFAKKQRVAAARSRRYLTTAKQMTHQTVRGGYICPPTASATGTPEQIGGVIVATTTGQVVIPFTVNLATGQVKLD